MSDISSIPTQICVRRVPRDSGPSNRASDRACPGLESARPLRQRVDKILVSRYADPSQAPQKSLPNTPSILSITTTARTTNSRPGDRWSQVQPGFSLSCNNPRQHCQRDNIVGTAAEERGRLQCLAKRHRRLRRLRYQGEIHAVSLPLVMEEHFLPLDFILPNPLMISTPVSERHLASDLFERISLRPAMLACRERP